MNNNITVKMFIVFLLTGMAACTSNLPPRLDPQQTIPYDAAEYYNWVMTASSDLMQREQKRLEETINVAGEEQSLVQLAVLISARAADFQQEKKALELLEQFERRAVISTVTTDYRALASLWRQVLEPRLQSHALREQIEALTSIEQRLDRRDQQGE